MSLNQMSLKQTNPFHARAAQCLLALLLAALAGGCTVAEVVRHPVAPPPQAAPAIAEAAALARENASLSGQAREDNAARIARLLAAMDDASLSREAAALPPGDPLYNFAGRALLSRGLPLPRPFDRAGDWHFDAGNRPPAEPDGYRPPLKLAVLLPLSGNLSRAAVPVRDGLLSGYYGEQRRRPEIRFYDTAGTSGGALAGYGRAVADGADFVIGPLNRDAVSALFRDQLTVPVLALNRGNVAPPPGNASFSLAPEDDGMAAAEYLLARGARRVLVLAGSDDGMRRAAAAFTEQLQGRGGIVARTLTVASEPGELTPALQAAAQAPGGIDAVFLAVDPVRRRRWSRSCRSPVWAASRSSAPRNWPMPVMPRTAMRSTASPSPAKPGARATWRTCRRRARRPRCWPVRVARRHACSRSATMPGC